MLGGSYYNGELNPGKHFYKVQPAGGIFWDAHINTRWIWRTMAGYSRISANDRDTEIEFNRFRDLQMTANVVDLSGQFIFNFMPYGNTINTKQYSPYVFVGLNIFHANSRVSSVSPDSSNGTVFPKEEYSSAVTSVGLPFGIGFKVVLGAVNLGIEWNVRKTFIDNLDGIDNQYRIGNVYEDPVTTSHPKGYQKGIFNTYDWYSMVGLTISYRSLPKKNACPGMF